MKTIELNERRAIIISGYSEQDFNAYVESFLTDAPLAVTEKAELKNRLLNFGSAFTSLLKPYFEEEKRNKRFDELTENMVEFIRRLKISIHQKKSDNTLFISFWKKLALKLDTEARTISDSYLINCCNFFKYEIDKFE
jgi:hypothetical protein